MGIVSRRLGERAIREGEEARLFEGHRERWGSGRSRSKILERATRVDRLIDDVRRDRLLVASRAARSAKVSLDSSSSQRTAGLCCCHRPCRRPSRVRTLH